jgi:hypothetical protein
MGNVLKNPNGKQANSLKDPGGATVQTTSSRKDLKTNPGDMPTWGAGMGDQQVTSSRMPLQHTPSPVANLENKPGRHGTPQVTASQMQLSRKASYPYQPTAKTNPQVDL